jgi:thiol-disulfide isomerase/thioredoxin
MTKQNIVGQFLITLILTLQISLAFPQAKSVNKNEFKKTNHSLIDKNIGKKFPVFTIKLSDSTSFSNKDFIDKIVFVNFWNDHCSPCLAEMDGLNMLYRELSMHSDFLLVSFSNDPDSVIKKSIIKNEIQFKVFKLSNETFSKLNTIEKVGC